MAVDLNLEQVPSGYNLSKINSNFNKIQDAFDDVLGRDGDVPNAMNTDFDLNGNDVLNGGVANFQSGFFNGVAVENLVGQAGPQGTPGTNGISFTWKGTYSGATAYVLNDVVSDQGSSWIAILATTGHAPPTLPTTSNTWWNLAAKVGDQGASGSGSGDMLKATYDPANIIQQILGTTATQTVTNKTINGSNNTITNVSLTSGVTGLLPLTNGGSDYGAKANAISVTATVSITSGLAALTATGATFTSTDIGKTIVVPGAGTAGGLLVTTIASFTDATHVGLTANASTTVSAVSKLITYGTDDTTAIQTQLTAGRVVVLKDNAISLITSALSISVSGSGIVGAGIKSSGLISTSTTVAMISVGSGVNNIVLKNFMLTRNTIGTGSAFGIGFGGNTEETLIDHLWIEKQSYGIAALTTSFSWISNCIITNNTNDGLLVGDIAAAGGMQWYLDNILSQSNGGRGFCFATGFTHASSVGTWTRLYTYANSSFGLAVIGISAAPINGVRLYNSFFGQDGNTEVYLDTYGSLHGISNVFLELAGTSLTGPTGATAASGIGSGLLVTANNIDVRVSDAYATQNSAAGFNFSASGQNSLTDSRGSSNGTYGVVFADGAKTIVVGCYFASNTTAQFSVTSNAGSIVAVANTPSFNEGTWTPTLSFGGGTVGLTYTTRQGRYSRTGNFVTLWCYILLSSKGSSTGTAQITGIPFTASSNVTYYGGGLPYYGNTISITNAGCAVVGGSANISLYSLPGNVWTNANFNNTTELVVSVIYEV